MAKDKDDHYTKAGAKALAERIEQFWHARGYRSVIVQPHQIPGFITHYGIRSNLIAGLPRTFR